MPALPVRFPLQKLDDVPVAHVEAIVEEANVDDLAALAGDRQAAELDDIFGAVRPFDSDEEDAPAACSVDPRPPSKRQRKSAIQASSAAAAARATPPAKRALFEFCCGEQSKLGEHAEGDPDCVVFRLTEAVDMSSKGGLDHAIGLVDALPPGWYVLLWGSLPCTAGSPWQRLNRKHPGARLKIEANIKIFEDLIDNFITLARYIVNHRNGDIAYEWPTECDLWNRPEVVNMIFELSLNKASFHGCALGLTAEDGLPIKKPWTVATSSKNIADRLSEHQCPGPATHGVHHPCAGKETKRTEEYTTEMVKVVHEAMHTDALDMHAATTLAAMVTGTTAPGELGRGE
eukprot:12984163-Heterocapsa_arctica.AAC.1